jgi:hypothetical protein
MVAINQPTIPDPAQDPATHYEPIKALKEAVELLTGQRGGALAPLSRMFIINIPPGNPNSGISKTLLRKGDLWIDTSNNSKLNYWNAATKVWVPTT